MRGERAVVTVGGKGSSLSSISVFDVANGLAQVRIDTSAFSKLSSSTNSWQLPLGCTDYLTYEEARASLLVLLNKLLLLPSGCSSSVILQLSDVLNLPNGECSTTTSDGDADVFLNSMADDAALQGVSALLDHQASALSTVADVVASLSCEALKADVATALGLMVDSGDGSSDKDRVVVANDFKTLLNGSKLIGKLECNQVSEIPKVHGRLRSVARSLHSAMRVELNSAVSRGGTGMDLATVLSPLALALKHLGEISWGRAKLIVDSLGSAFGEIFNMRCPNIDSLVDLIKSSQAAYLQKEYIKSLHDTYNLSETVRKILSWEAAIAFVSLDGSGLIRGCTPSSRAEAVVSEENAKGETKKNKEKRKKVVLGKGTNVLVQLITEQLKLETTGADDSGGLVLMEKWAKDFLSILDPKDPGFEFLLKKVKEIIDSNESRRLPKLPKVTIHIIFFLDIFYFEK